MTSSAQNVRSAFVACRSRARTTCIRELELHIIFENNGVHARRNVERRAPAAHTHLRRRSEIDGTASATAAPKAGQVSVCTVLETCYSSHDSCTELCVDVDYLKASLESPSIDGR